MKDFSLKLVRVIDHPNNDGDRNEQIAFLQGPKTCFDLCAVETESYMRAEFTKDAELIVTAVNNFDKMKEALIEATEALDGLSDILSNHYGDDPEETPHIDKAIDASVTIKILLESIK